MKHPRLWYFWFLLFWLTVSADFVWITFWVVAVRDGGNPWWPLMGQTVCVPLAFFQLHMARSLE